MKYFMVTDKQNDIITWSQRLYSHKINYYIKQLYTYSNPHEPDIHVVFEKPDNMSIKDICSMCNTKEAYLYFDTKEEWT